MKHKWGTWKGKRGKPIKGTSVRSWTSDSLRACWEIMWHTSQWSHGKFRMLEHLSSDLNSPVVEGSREASTPILLAYFFDQLSYFTETVIPRPAIGAALWNYSKPKFSGPIWDLLKQNTWMWGPISCIQTSLPGDSDAQWRLRVTLLKKAPRHKRKTVTWDGKLRASWEVSTETSGELR